MLKGFRDFILRGNLVELAVAFVMGVAFASIVTSFVDNLLMPLVGTIGGEPDFSGIALRGIPVGAFINDVVAFLMTAAAIYFLVIVPYTKVTERLRSAPATASEAVSEEVALLREIRDLLARPG